MQSYIEDMLKSMERKWESILLQQTKACLVVNQDAKELGYRAKFHAVVAKLLYLEKYGWPDVLLPMQLQFTRVKASSVKDKKKLERF